MILTGKQYTPFSPRVAILSYCSMYRMKSEPWHLWIRREKYVHPGEKQALASMIHSMNQTRKVFAQTRENPDAIHVLAKLSVCQYLQYWVKVRVKKLHVIGLSEKLPLCIMFGSITHQRYQSLRKLWWGVFYYFLLNVAHMYLFLFPKEWNM